MDTSTGKTYATVEEAQAAGVPLERLVRMVVIRKGPFKGRIYEQGVKGTLGRRRPDLEAKERERQRAEREDRVALPRQVRRPQATFREITAEEV